MEEQVSVNTGRDNFIASPYSLTSAFAVALLLFLLPFIQVKCGSTTLAENTGIGLATGAQWKIATDWGKNPFTKELNEAMPKDKNDLKTKPNIFAIIAITVGVLGLLFSLLKNPLRAVVCMSAGILGTIMLIAMLIQLKIMMRSASGKGEFEAGIGTIIKVQFTIWYFLSLFCYASAGYLGYRHHRNELEEQLKEARDFEFERRD